MLKIKGLLLSAVILTLGGCAIYSPRPLPKTTQFKVLSKVEIAHPLGMAEVAQLAVLHSPALEIERQKKNVAEAQAFQAGLLPNPQASAGIDHPTDNGSGLFNGYSYGLSFDLLGLITHPTDSAIASAKRKQAKEDLLWQEWQTVAKARLLFVQAQIASQRVAFLSKAESSFNFGSKAINAATAKGDLAPDQAESDLAVLADIQGQLGAARRQKIAALSDLKALLDLVPNTSLRLQELGSPTIPSSSEIGAALRKVIKRRPDLIALRDGYAAQEETVFKAVLSQFPNLQIGFTKARDTSDVHTTSFGVTLNLPLFDRGQGHVAIERATRDQLHTEYQIRINQTESSAARLQSEDAVVAQRLKNLEPEIVPLKEHALNAARSAQSGDISIALETQFIQSWLTRQNELLDLKEALWKNAIALDTLLASPLQKTSLSDKDTHS